MKHTEGKFYTKDNLSLYTQSWEPDGIPSRVICLVHGLGEHSGRYPHLAKFLNQSGNALYAFDLRGHGNSQGQRGHSPDYENLMDDINGALEQVTQRYPNTPCFLYGHSLGGNLVLNYSIQRRPQLAGVIATGPLLRTAFTPPGWKISLGKILYHWVPTLSMTNEIDTRVLSRDTEVVRAYVEDPLVHNRVSARLGIGMLEAGRWVLEHAAEFSLPLLIMHGSADKLTSVDASREFAARAGKICTLKVWDGFYHEIHNEPEQKEVFTYMLDWVKGQDSGGSMSVTPGKP